VLECGAFMRRAVEQSKLHLIRALYFEHKAYQYWALRTQAFDVADRSVAHLRATHEQLRNSVLFEKENRNRNPQRFTTNPPVVLTAVTHPHVFEGLLKGQLAVFNIPISGSREGDTRAFRGRAEVTVNKIIIRMPGARTSDGDLFVRLRHNGRADFRTRSGQFLSFTHAPRVTFVQFPPEGGEASAPGDLGGQDGEYAYLSPFATWTLEVPASENRGLDLSGLKQIELNFEGFAVASEV
jgi:hypothetical protein